MGKAVPAQHPAVVLRSQFEIVRTLLAAAMIAVVGLSLAIVILASDANHVSNAGTSSSVYSIRQGGFNPALHRPGSVSTRHEALGALGSTRYDGGPEEGTRGISAEQAPSVPDHSLNGPGARTD